MLSLVPEIALSIDSVKFQTDSLRLPSRAMGERVFLIAAERIGRDEELDDWDEELEEVVVLVTVIVSVEELLAASLAVTVMTLVPTISGTEDTDHDVVPDTVPQEEPFTVQAIEAMPEESDAVPERAIVD